MIERECDGMIEVGVASINITPPPGLAMVGFAARTECAIGAHDPLSVRALVVGQTALVTADVIGIDAAMSKRVRTSSCLPEEAITIVATHTHGGPASMQDRLWNEPDPQFLTRLEAGLVEVINTAAASKRPASLYGGTGSEPGFAKNRRHKDGAVDTGIPVVRFDDPEGVPFAIFMSYACHPVVLAADNLLWTADYIHFARQEVEAAYPEAIAVFATGCAGDVNTGHSAAGSLTKSGNSQRSFGMAEQIGKGIAKSVAETSFKKLGKSVGSAEQFLDLDFQPRETGTGEELARQYRDAAEQNPGKEFLYKIWADWARNKKGKNINPLRVRCSALSWGDSVLISLPGEVFAETAIRIRRKIANDHPVFLLAYADDNPGYIPPESEFEFGGYEIDEAHRFYGLGATFAPGSAERLERAGQLVAERAAFAATQEDMGKIQP